MPADADPDRRARKILFDAYWTSAGWRDGGARSIPRDELEHAKRAGLMFDDVSLTHDDVVKRAATAVRTVDRRRVVDAFVSSLSSRRLDQRSALGSFAVLQHLPDHRDPGTHANCPVCGAYGGGPRPVDLNVLSFERLKWGGVRHDKPLYASFDLELFARLPPSSVFARDVAVLRTLLDSLASAPPDTSSASVEKCFAAAFPSNKAERNIVVGLLGLCGVLGTEAHPGYMRDFVPWTARTLPPRRFVDMAYPACWWRQSDGVNSDAVEFWFGHLL